ncbi:MULTISPECIES: MerR family transcriptional regulator [Aerococcus]|uniref:MerR family transcriptional regulator n=1 Tax=Aerococcus tenax TaxID=3078812 RepID=A0A5N1BRG5_9LACT|nr:MerR family transcriptional regulator [Aerococcus urinae]KAA9242788.1 MerR family transcriptional regulator [Aerococcus urinae]MDK6370980.1 MerR family transcriptional regulator [Aerococcus urinae]MDK6598009.1 MerR family transcriptional regulator [Aerococcus urinae]MDK7301813.1 MerR family transcriptional regulator [Aerococcus urinae]MDK7801235.1 MerR family transcriptional regulator [Aerococcus urinae]
MSNSNNWKDQREKAYEKSERKKRQKKKWGKLFTWAMLLALVSSVVISLGVAVYGYFF